MTIQYSVTKETEMLAGAQPLTERQAEAYVYREMERLSRDKVDIWCSTLDDYRFDAAAKVELAERTLDVLEKIQRRREANV